MLKDNFQAVVYNPEKNNFDPIATSPLNKLESKGISQILYGIPNDYNFFGRLFRTQPGFDQAKIQPGNLFIAELRTANWEGAASFSAIGFSKAEWQAIEQLTWIRHKASEDGLLNIFKLTRDQFNNFATFDSEYTRKQLADLNFSLSPDQYRQNGTIF